MNTNIEKNQLRKRAREIAATNGRAWKETSEADFTQARQELASQPDLDPKTRLLEAAPESQRWDPVGGSTGHKVPVAPIEDEDEEGRSVMEKLVEKGAADAEQDQARQAGKSAATEP